MFENLEILRRAQAMAGHATQRQNLVAQNVANADTPDYRAKDLTSFAETYEAQTGFSLRTSRAGHMGASDTTFSGMSGIVESAGDISPSGNAVSLEEEMVKSVDIKRQHDLALTIYKSALNVMRSSIGKA